MNSENQQPGRVHPNNDRTLKKLSRGIRNAQGNFSLILASSNYRSLTGRIVERLKETCSIPFQELHLRKSVETLYTPITEFLKTEHPQALMVFGLESVTAVEKILTSTNQVREEFRKNCPFPVVLWVNDEILQQMTHFAPDFKSWAAIPIKFKIADDDLRENLGHTLDSVLETLLEVGAGKFIQGNDLELAPGSLSLCELESAGQDFQEQNQSLDADLEANLQFIIGREAYGSGNTAKARECYERSVQIWQECFKTAHNPSPTHLNHYGCLLFHLGLWWRQEATVNRAKYQEFCQQAKEYYQQCLAAFQQSKHPELEQRFINPLGEVLTRLEAWNELKTVAHQGIKLHQTYSDSLRLSSCYGFLAEVALQEKNWLQAQDYAKLALQHNEKPSDSTIDWSLSQNHIRNYCRFLLARSQQHLDQIPDAIANLERAKTDASPESDPPLYIRILETLRRLKFDQGEYLEAFEIKQEKQSIEQQYGLRAFVGAGRLQSRRQVENVVLAPKEGEPNISDEIAASGRLQDIERLLQRMGRPDCKLTTIHGQSGVGKSSLVQAGLIPVLKEKTVEGCPILPVLLQVYSNWAEDLGTALAQIYQERCNKNLSQPPNSQEILLNELRETGERNLLVVLIFDQFEEFFFAYKDPEQRKPFFEFLSNCLNIPYVKVILSLREDYLHYLLECSRITNLDIIDNNILDKNILYYLGNLQPEDAKSVIETLTWNSQFYLDADLLEALVKDLAGDIREVRPIELQVVGSQLQTENITTLGEFEKKGPKEALVERFLEEIVQDCGVDNEGFVKIILYLLTDENNTRPLKTRGEIKNEVELEDERLNSILQILVESGLVFKVPGFPKERYQLVHDYLVPFIRQKQSARLVAELEKEREQRKLTEKRLNQTLKKQLQASRRATWTLAGLLLGIIGFAGAVTVAGFNLYINSLVSDSSTNTEIDRLVSAIKAGKTLKQFPVGIPGLRLKVAAEINSAISSEYAISLLGHTDSVTKVVFSPDNKLIASASEDKTIKVWDLEGNILHNITKYSDKIVNLKFSPNSQFIASVNENDTIEILTVDGQLQQELSFQEDITNISWSPDNKILAISSGTNIELREIASNKIITTITGHTGEITNIKFSPNGQRIVASDRNDQVKIWSLNGQELGDIQNYGTIDIRFSEDSTKLILINKNGRFQAYKEYIINNNLDDNLVKNIEFITKIKTDKFAGIYYNENYINIGFIASINESKNEKIIFTSLWGQYSDQSIIDAHPSRINDLTLSPNGQMLASASQDKSIRLWSTKTLLQNHHPMYQHRIKSENSVNKIKLNQKTHNTIATARLNNDYEVYLFHRKGQVQKNKVQLYHQQSQVQKTLAADGSSLKFSPDGQTLLTGSVKNQLKLYHLDGQMIELWEHPNGIASASISPDGKTIISVSHDGVLKFLDSNGQLIRTQNISSFTLNSMDFLVNTQPVIQFSPDGQRVIIITNKNIYLFKNNGKLITNLNGHTNVISKVKFSPDSQLIAVTGDNNFIYLYTQDGKEIEVLKDHKNRVVDFDFNANSTILASTSKNVIGLSKIHFWERNGKLINPWNDYDIQKIQFSPDNVTIAVSNYSMVKIRNIEGKVIAILPNNGQLSDLSFSPDGEVLAYAGESDIVWLWRKQESNPIHSLREHLDTVRQVVFSPNGQTFASVSNDGMLQLWSKDGQPIKTLQNASKEDLSSKNPQYRIEFSEDSQVIVLISTLIHQGESNSTIKFWNSKGEEITTFQAQQLWNLDQIIFSTGSKTIALIERVPEFKLWDFDGSDLATFSGHQAQINSVSFSPDGEIVASASDDNTVKLWNRDGQLLETLKHEDEVNSVSFSPDGQFLASGSDDTTVKLWSREGKLLKPFDHKDKVNVVSFSPDGKFLASASDDETVKLWKRKGNSWKELRYSPLGHSDKIKNIYFSEDGKALVSITENNTITLWQVHNGQHLIKPIENSEGSDIVSFSPNGKLLVTNNQFLIPHGTWFDKAEFSGYSWEDFQFSPDGKTIVGTGSDGIEIFDFDLDILLEKACDLAKNYLENSTELSDRDKRLCDGIID